MDATRRDQLVQRQLDGLLTSDEMAEFVRLISSDSETADAFVAAAKFDNLLEAHYQEQPAVDWSSPNYAASYSGARGNVSRFSTQLLSAAAAAVLLIGLAGLGWLSRDRSSTAAVHHVVQGRVLIEGVEVRSFADGVRFETLGQGKAVIQLAGGGEVQIEAASSAVFHTAAAQPNIELNYGSAHIVRRVAPVALRIATPAGTVSGQDAEYSVELQSTADSEVTASNSPLLALLTVAVLAGQVEVQEADQMVNLAAGETRAFAPTKKPLFAGRVIEVSHDGKQVTLEGKPPKSGAEPQRRTVRIGDDTELVYFGVPRGGDRPSIGYSATALLKAATPDEAERIDFGDKNPRFIGPVRRVAADGRSFTLEMYRKSDSPLEQTITINDQTRVSYSDVAKEDERPTLGYQAHVWTPAGSQTATEIRFIVKGKGAATNKTDAAGIKPVAVQKSASNSRSPATEMPVERPSGKPATKPNALNMPKSIDPKAKPNAEAVMSTVGTKSESTAKPAVTRQVRRTSRRDAGAPTAEIDRAIDARLKTARLPASPQAGDAEFLRRVSLDITGLIPTYAATATFLASDDANKRTALVEELLAQPAYGRRFAAVWKRAIQPKPAGNGKPQVDKFTPWLAEQFNANRGWDEIVFELLTTDANLAREPQAYFLSVNSENFEPKPNLLTASTTKLFLGVQLGCAECHNHPFAEWKQTQFWNLAAFFGQVHKRSKSDFTLLDEARDPAQRPQITLPDGGTAAGKVVPALFLGGGQPTTTEAIPLRVELARWTTSRDNPYFARAMANRLWAHFFGRGLVEPLDGFQDGFTPSHPEVLDLLTAEFIASDFDIQHLVRLICRTQAYRRTSMPLPENERDTELNSRMSVKVIAPDMLYDSLTIAAGGRLESPQAGKPGKSQQPPEFSIGPREEFINFFTGPAVEARSEEYSLGIPQLLRLMNSTALNTATPIAEALARRDDSLEDRVEALYLAVLSRKPTDDERQTLGDYVKARQGTSQAFSGALWILLNSSEFVLNR